MGRRGNSGVHQEASTRYEHQKLTWRIGLRLSEVAKCFAADVFDGVPGPLSLSLGPARLL